MAAPPAPPPDAPLASCLYVGSVRHRRFAPRDHAFTYPLFMVLLDLDELPRVFARRWFWSVERPNLASFRRRDHLGTPDVPLGDAVRDLVARRTGRRPPGPVRLLTHLRYFGYGFNPVSFYYCYDAAGERVETIVAEVDNTPWNEQHCYVLDRADVRPDAATASGSHGDLLRWHFPKAFHVSPFLDMGYWYDWRFSVPADALTVHMENLRDGASHFDATMTMRRRPMTSGAMARVLLAFPFMTLQVIGAIYFEALRLRLKGIPFLDHPTTHQPAPDPAPDPDAPAA